MILGYPKSGVSDLIERSKVKVRFGACSSRVNSNRPHHKSRTKLHRHTKIDRTDNNVHQFQGQRSRSPGRLMMRTEVRHIFRMERPIWTWNLVHRWSTKTRYSCTDKRRDLQGQRSRSQGHIVRLTVVGPYVEKKESQKHRNWWEYCELQTWYTDGHGSRRPISPTSVMTSEVKCQGR